jgi:uncharacterized membrane protein
MNKDSRTRRITGGVLDRLAPAARTVSRPGAPPEASRIMGIDAARGLALVGMIAVHTFDEVNDNGTPTLALRVFGGRSMATFVLLAGVSLALMTGRQHPLEGRSRTAASAGLAVRAGLIGLLGLALGYPPSDVEIILPYYAVMFLLALPLLGLRPRVLAGAAAVIAVVVPVITLLLRPHLPVPGDDNLTFDSLLHPFQMATNLLLTGPYPALAFMAYICAGIAIGRLRLSSTRVAAWLLGGGVALALVAWETSSVLLLHMGGLHHLTAAIPPGIPQDSVQSTLMWAPDHPVSSWWWLAVRAPYSVTPVDLAFSGGVAIAVLAAMLLLTSSRAAGRALEPLAAVGSMTLTLYTASVLFLAIDPLGDYTSSISYAVQLAGAFAFAILWRRFEGRGPLETVVAVAAGRARRAVAPAPARRP